MAAGLLGAGVEMDYPRNVAGVLDGQAVESGDEIVGFGGVIHVGNEIAVAVDQDGEDSGEFFTGDAHGFPDAFLALLERQAGEAPGFEPVGLMVGVGAADYAVNVMPVVLGGLLGVEVEQGLSVRVARLKSKGVAILAGKCRGAHRLDAGGFPGLNGGGYGGDIGRGSYRDSLELEHGKSLRGACGGVPFPFGKQLEDWE